MTTETAGTATEVPLSPWAPGMSVADLAGARLALIKAKDWPSLSDVMRELLMHTALHGEMVPVTTVKEGDYLSGRLVTGIRYSKSGKTIYITGIHPGDRIVELPQSTATSEMLLTPKE